jgi:RNA recognition motif-containing protein
MPKPKKTAPVASAKPGEKGEQRTNAQPNKILFVTNLPQDTTEVLIRSVFER